MAILTSKTGCTHYKSNCLIVCNKCNRTYPCIACHDKNENHLIDKYKVTKMLCMQCGCIQKKAQTCIKCETILSEYFCEKCSLWCGYTNIFHCAKCNVCRVGSPQDYFHCEKCGACIEINAKSHSHTSDGIRNNCPICAEYMFDSTRQVVLLRCGHAIHEECYEANLENSMNCPICFKLVGDDINIRAAIKEMIKENKHECPRGEQICGFISCLECGKVGFTRNFSMFNECIKCGSFNTKLKGDN